MKEFRPAADLSNKRGIEYFAVPSSSCIQRLESVTGNPT